MFFSLGSEHPGDKLQVKRWAIVKGIALLALLLSFVLFPSLRVFAESLNPERIGEWLDEAGGFAPLLFVILTATAVVVSPIPTLPLDIAAGAFFGPFLGGIYAVGGALLGAIASFLIARLLGRGLIEPILGGHINFCSECSDKLLTRIVFLSRLLPFVSFDVVSYGAGLTKISVGKFALATGTGMMPLTFAFTYFGSVVSVGPAVTIATGVVLVALFFLIPRWIEKKDLLGLRHHFRHEKHRVLRN